MEKADWRALANWLNAEVSVSIFVKLQQAVSAKAIVLSVCILASGCIVATYSRLSHTVDEPTHLAAGIEWLQYHRYSYQTENPPISRVVLALIPYYAGGARIPPPENRPAGFASDLFYRTSSYFWDVTEARVSTLVSFWLVVGLTWLIAGGGQDRWSSVVAAVMVATVPPIVAHSGFATTDVPFLAAFLASVWAYIRVLLVPTPARVALFAFLLGISIATKFSTFAFFPVVAIALLACLWKFVAHGFLKLRAVEWLTLAATAILTLLITVWACYGFSIGTLDELPSQFSYGSMPKDAWFAHIKTLRLPAPEFFHGVLYFLAHSRAGHPSVLFGQLSDSGFWYFYPVTFAAKTPLLFLALMLIGFVCLYRAPESIRRSSAIALAVGGVGILAVSSTSSINLGIRHVLVIYPLFFIAAAHGLTLWAEGLGARRKSMAVAGIGAALTAQFAILVLWIPNQIGYRNLAVVGEPGYVINDSDLDWGQDILALQSYVKHEHISELYLLDRGSTNPCKHDFPNLKGLPVGEPVSGWIAVFERPYWLNSGNVRKHPCERASIQAPAGWLDWLHSYKPIATIGTGVRVYHIEQQSTAPPIR